MKRKRTSSRRIVPQRIPPADASADAVERILPRRHLELETGDVVIVRERVPRVNPKPLSSATQWRYSLRVHPDPAWKQVFSGFSAAASEGEQLASKHHTRLMFVEDEIPALLANYRTR